MRIEHALALFVCLFAQPSHRWSSRGLDVRNSYEWCAVIMRVFNTGFHRGPGARHSLNGLGTFVCNMLYVCVVDTDLVLKFCWLDLFAWLVTKWLLRDCFSENTPSLENNRSTVARWGWYYLTKVLPDLFFVYYNSHAAAVYPPRTSGTLMNGPQSL